MKFQSVTVLVEAVEEDGTVRQIEWDIEPSTLRIEQLREMEGMPHPIEPEVLRALPFKLTIKGDVKSRVSA